MNSLSKNLTSYKAGNQEALTEILFQMEPLIIKYARKTFPLEFEDAKQEYYIAIVYA